jgi:hypothetical protein
LIILEKPIKYTEAEMLLKDTLSVMGERLVEMFESRSQKIKPVEVPAEKPVEVSAKKQDFNINIYGVTPKQAKDLVEWLKRNGIKYTAQKMDG